MSTSLISVIYLTLSYAGPGGAWIPPLLTLVLNSVSGIQAIVLMHGCLVTFPKIYQKFLSKFEGYGVFCFHSNRLPNGYFYEVLSKIV